MTKLSNIVVHPTLAANRNKTKLILLAACYANIVMHILYTLVNSYSGDSF